MGQSQDERDRIAFQMQKSPFTNYTQLNDETFKDLIYLNTINPLATNILYFMIENANNYNAVIVSQKTLGQIFGKSHQTISNAVRVLKEHKFINIKKDGRGNIYFVNASLIWKSYGSNHKFAEFNAKIIFSEEEVENLNLEKTLLRKGTNIVSSNLDE